MKSHPLILSLIFINFVVYALVSFLPDNFANIIFSLLLLKPYTFHSLHSPHDFFLDLISLFGYGFLHTTLFHLLGNMAGLLIFGTALTRTFSSSLTTLFIYLFAISVAALDIIIQQQNYSLGASGGISGLMGALCSLSLFHPKIFLYHNPKIKRKTILSFSIFWLAINIIFALIPPSSDLIPFANINLSSIGWTLHIIGFLAGFFILFLIPKKLLKSP